METIQIFERGFKVLSYVAVFYAAFVQYHRVAHTHLIPKLLLLGIMIFAGTDILEVFYKKDRISYSQFGLNICYAGFLGYLCYHEIRRRVKTP
jgi:hypothetical protein